MNSFRFVRLLIGGLLFALLLSAVGGCEFFDNHEGNEDGELIYDFDGDGTADPEDCAPADPNIHADATEICDDLVDNDCDSLTDCADLDCASFEGC